MRKARPMAIMVLRNKTGRMPNSYVAISGRASMLSLSCPTASPKDRSVTIMAGKMSLPITPESKLSQPVAYLR